MHAFEYGLRGARGAVIAAGGEGGITRLRFAQYSASQRSSSASFPGACGFGFVRRVPAAQEAAFVAAARLDGKPDFQIHQLSPNEGERFVIQYFEPSDSTARRSASTSPPSHGGAQPPSAPCGPARPR